MTKLTPETRDKLKGVSTATLSSALYKRGLRNQMIQDVRPLSAPKGGSMVGEAYTLRYMPAREDLNPMTVFRDRSHPQRRSRAMVVRNKISTAPMPISAATRLCRKATGRRQTRISATR